MNKQNNNIEKDIKRFIIEGYTNDTADYWKKFAKDVIKEVDKELSTKVTMKDLQKQSQIFLQRINETYLLTKDNFDVGWFSESLGSTNKNTQLQTIQLRLQYAAAFSYSRYIHKILGLPLAKAIVVFDVKGAEQKDGDAGDVFAKEIFLSDLIKSAGSSGKFHIAALNELAYGEVKKGDEAVLKALNTLEEQLKNEYKEKNQQQQNEIENHINKVKMAYNYIATKSKEKKGSKKGSKQFYVRLPKQEGGWGTYTFLNYGDLKEAYAAALIEQHISKNMVIEQHINKNADPLCQTTNIKPRFLAAIFFNRYVTQVDNKGALLGEDIIAMHRGDKGLQYAAKATHASLPSLQQYIDFANAAKKAKKITKKSIKKMADSWEEIDKTTGRKKGQRNRELTETEAEEVKTLFKQAVEQS